MKKLFSYFVKNHKLAFLIGFLLLFLGLSGINTVRRETRPPVDFASASIVTIYPGSSPQEIEEGITDRIEERLRGIEGIKDVSSTSEAGQSKIVVRVDMDDYDSQRVLDDIQRELQRVQRLPEDLPDPPIFTHFNAAEIPILKLALSGSNERRKRDQLVRFLQDELEDVPGVATVQLSGFREREFQVLLDSKKMDRLHVGISEVVEAVKRRTQNIPAGYLKQPGDQRLVRVTGQIDSTDELQDIVVRSNFSGQNIRIKDIAKVEDGMEDADILVRVNGHASTTLVVTKTAESDTIQVNQMLLKKMRDFEARLPAGYSIVVYDDESERIGNRLEIVVDNALFGLVLVLIILFIFLPGSLGLAASLSLPLAVMGTIGLMPLLGVNFNNITLLAFVIALGMLVDNAVVISENYARLRFEGLSRNDAAIKAVHQFWLPIVATVATTVIAFLPMLVTSGIMGQFIRWIPIMVSVALSVSLFEAFFLLPSRLKFTVKSLHRYKKTDSEGSTTWFDRWRIQFESFMRFCIKKRYWVTLAISLLMISSAVVSIVGNRFELFPSEHVEYYNAKYETSITNTLEETDIAAAQFSQRVIDALGSDVVKYVISNTGASQFGFRDPQAKRGSYVGMLTIAIPMEVAQNTNTKEMLEKLRSIPVEPFEKLTFSQSRNGPAVGTPLDITLRAKDYNLLKKVVEEVKGKIEKIEGVVDLQDDMVSGGKELRIEPKHDILARLNLDTQTVGLALRSALQGSVPTELTQDGDVFKLRIRYGDRDRATVAALNRTKIMEKTQKLIPLSSLVKIHAEEGPNVRKHYNFKRSVSITADVVPEQITSLALNQKAQKIIEAALVSAPGVSVTFGGEQESTRESTQSLKTAMVIAVFGIFAVLVFLFGEFLTSFLVISCIPLGLVGVGWAFFLHQRPLSFLAMIGVVGLAGVVVNSAIVLVSFIKDLQKEGRSEFKEILAIASAHRLRAVMVTSLTTIGGLFPTAYGIGGYDPILVPMTLALAWGLVSGTLLTLIWVPCGYAIINDLTQVPIYIHNRFASKRKKQSHSTHQTKGVTDVL